MLTNGFAFTYDENGVQGLLTGKRAMVVVTAGGTEEDFGKNADQLTKSTTKGTLAFCGITDIVDRVFYSAPIVEDDARKKILKELAPMVEAF